MMRQGVCSDAWWASAMLFQSSSEPVGFELEDEERLYSTHHPWFHNELSDPVAGIFSPKLPAGTDGFA